MDTPGNGHAIETVALTKRFGEQMALDQLDLHVERGEIFGFLGPNGAGKSTTIRLLLDLIRPTSGSAAVLGHDCQAESRDVRALIGYLPGDLRLYPGLTGRETVELFAALRPGPIDRGFLGSLVDHLGLDLDRRAGGYSKGTRQKLGVVLALLARPPVLLLDEPTSGLDPIVQHAVWEILRAEAARGTTIFFSSHVMSEVEQVCERVGVVRAGRLVAVEPITRLKGRSYRHVEVSFTGAAPTLGPIPGVTLLRSQGPTLEFEVRGEIDSLLKALAPYHVADLRTQQPTLDELLVAFYRESAA